MCRVRLYQAVMSGEFATGKSDAFCVGLFYDLAMDSPPQKGTRVTVIAGDSTCGNAFGVPDGGFEVMGLMYDVPTCRWDVILSGRHLKVEDPLVVAKGMIDGGWELLQLPTRDSGFGGTKRHIPVRVADEDVVRVACADDLALMNHDGIKYRNLSAK